MGASLARSAQGTSRFPFRLILPVGQLIVCFMLLWPSRPFIVMELGLPARFAQPPIFFHSAAGIPVLSSYGAWARQHGMRTIACIDLPAGMVQLPYVANSASKTEWTPHGVSFEVWRAITWPFLGMVFWWISGRGADALIAAQHKKLAPRITWLETGIGFMNMSAGAFLFVGFLFFDDSRNDPARGQLIAAGAMWAILGGLTVAARTTQWRLRKRLSRLEPA